jgi:hypothetical protein
MMPTKPFYANSGDGVRFEYNAQGGGDWYEAAIVLYKIDNGGRESIDQVRLVRGLRLNSFVEEEFTSVGASSNYMLRFFMASYDKSGGTVLGAKMTIKFFGLVDNQ